MVAGESLPRRRGPTAAIGNGLLLGVPSAGLVGGAELGGLPHCSSFPSRNHTYGFFFFPPVTVLPRVLLDLLGLAFLFCYKLESYGQNFSLGNFAHVKKAFPSLNCSGPALLRAAHPNRHFLTSAALLCVEKCCVWGQQGAPSFTPQSTQQYP